MQEKVAKQTTDYLLIALNLVDCLLKLIFIDMLKKQLASYMQCTFEYTHAKTINNKKIVVGKEKLIKPPVALKSRINYLDKNF